VEKRGVVIVFYGGEFYCLFYFQQFFCCPKNISRIVGRLTSNNDNYGLLVMRPTTAEDKIINKKTLYQIDTRFFY